MSGRSIRDVAVRWLPPILWMAAIFVVSDQPSLPSAPDALFDMLIKKSLHAVAYAILAWLWWRALRDEGGSTVRDGPKHSPESDRFGVRATDVRIVLTSLAITSIYAISDEWHQTFVPGRMGKSTDVLIDVAGATVALMALTLRSALATRHRRGGLHDSQ